MSVFNLYSRYYNLLYKDKNYHGEALYIDRLIKQYTHSAKTILNLGCGTGKHDFILSKLGYHITGVDLSPTMIAEAQESLHAADDDYSHLPQFIEGDIRTTRLNQKYDVVLSLFHVLSYQVSNHDLLAAIETAKVHIKPGGVFIFDAWYGPGVLTDPPTVRVKRLEDDTVSITRIAEPVMHPDRNVVDVNYSLFIQNKQEGSYTEMQETHRMRYLFLPEIEFFVHQAGLDLLHSEEWFKGNKPGYTWNICVVCRSQT